MKKVTAFLVAAFAACMLFAADEFTVKSVKGKVSYEAEPGVMKTVTAGQKLSLSTVINTAVNSTLVITKADGSDVTIKAMKKGTVESLSSVQVSKGISKGTVAKDNTADARSSEKGVATASSRASDAKADYDWEE